MSRNQRLSFLGVAAAIAVVAIVIFVVSGSGSEETSDQADETPTPTPPTSATGTATATATATATPKPQPPLLQAGSVKKLEFEEGDTVSFRVRHDAREEVHVHGYDITKDLEPG